MGERGRRGTSIGFELLTPVFRTGASDGDWLELVRSSGSLLDAIIIVVVVVEAATEEFEVPYSVLDNRKQSCCCSVAI